jgi:putative membrane protein
MKLIAQILIALVAIEHLYILWIEMFAWTTAGRKTFKTFPADLFEPTKALAANQGLYNGFLSAGLIWSLLIMVQLPPVKAFLLSKLYLLL